MIEKSFGLLLSALIIGVALAVVLNVVFPQLDLSPSIALFIGLVSVAISWGVMRLRQKTFQNEQTGTGFKISQKSMSTLNRKLLIFAFFFSLFTIPLQGKSGVFTEPTVPHPVLLSQLEPSAIGNPSLRVRLDQASAAIAEDSRFFQETIALEHELESIVGTDVTKKKYEIVQLLQKAAYQASRLATELHLLRAKLQEDIFPVLEFLKPNLSGELNQVLVPIKGSKAKLEQTVGQVLQEISPSSQENSLENALQPGSLGDVLAKYVEQNQVLFEELQPLHSVLSKIKKKGVSTFGSVYEFLDRKTGEDTDYGLFTYIIFNGQHSRNTKFLERLLASTKRASEAYQKKTKKGLHIFYLPVKNKLGAKFSLISEGEDDQSRDYEGLAKSLATSHYDDVLATDLFVQFCLSAKEGKDSTCRLSGQGPYLLTVAQPLSQTNSLQQPGMLLDFSPFEEETFGEFIQAFKDQALVPDFDKVRKVETMRLQILQVIVKVAKSIRPVGEGIKEFLKFFI